MTTSDANGGAERRGGAPSALGDLLRPWISQVGRTSRRRRSAVVEAWERAAGPALAAETRPSTLQRGVLTVEVRSSGLLAELQGFRTEELLSRLLSADPSVRVTGLRFRPGVF